MNQNFLNARPSEVQNLGVEVLGAARHRNDTYDNPEHEAVERKKKSDLKESKAQIEALKKMTIEFIPEEESHLGDYLGIYETRLFQIQSMLRFETDVLPYEDLKAWVISKRSDEMYNTYRLRFNKMLKNKRIVKYRVRTADQAIDWIEPKKRVVDSFREMNGRTSAWNDPALRLSEETAKSVLNMARAVQFGNSVPDQERAYVVYNLNLGLNWLKGLLPQFDLNALAYSFGARGNAKSVAYYQDGSKLISVNRHNEGSLVHEIGHAIDYKLNKISYSMPYAFVHEYKVKINSLPYNHKEYLSKKTEIFARLFERYIFELAKDRGINEFMLSINPEAIEMPEFTEQAKDYMAECLRKLE